MNWTAVSFDWNQVRAFWATAEEGSFSAAARALDLTQPTLGRQVAGLEDALGVTLFERAGRSLALTEAGRELLVHTRAMGEAAQHISLTASGASRAIEGLVRITAADVMCHTLLPPLVAEIRRAAPGIEIDIVADNAITDLTRRDADIAIRHVRPVQPDLTAKLVQEAKGRLYAATSYLEEKGRPRTLQALAGYDFISFGDVPLMISFLNEMGIPVTPANLRVGSKNGTVAWELVRQGLGLALMNEDIGTTTPGIEAVFPDDPPITYPVWLVTHRELHTSRRIRLVYDMLAAGLSRKAS
ncbi:MAG: LysR family transcriptional regulator [Pseudomonadota bacterium]